MDPILGSAVIGGVSSLLGNIFGSSSNASTNRTNLRIAQMNNEFNERMLDKQISFNQDMFDQQIGYDSQKWRDQYAAQQSYDTLAWNRNNAYNDPSRQRSRLERAGLNPYLMMNGGSAGTASGGSVPNASGGSPGALGVSPPTATPVSVQPYNYDFSGISGIIPSLIDYYANKDLKASQAGNLWQDLSLKKALYDTDVAFGKEKLSNMIADTWDKTTRAKAGMNQNLMFDLTWQEQVKQARQQTYNLTKEGELMNADIISKQMQTELWRKELSWMDERVRSEIAVKVAEAYNMYASGYCNYKQAAMYVENAIKIEAEAAGVRINNGILYRSSKWLVDLAKTNSMKARNENNLLYWQSKSAKHNSGPNNLYQYLNDIGVNPLSPLAQPNAFDIKKYKFHNGKLVPK